MGAAGPVGSPVGLASVVRLMAVLVTALSVQSLAVILLGRARVFSVVGMAWALLGPLEVQLGWRRWFG